MVAWFTCLHGRHCFELHSSHRVTGRWTYLLLWPITLTGACSIDHASMPALAKACTAQARHNKHNCIGATEGVITSSAALAQSMLGTSRHSPLLPSAPAKRHSFTGRRMRMAPLMTAALVFAAGTAVLLLLAHRLSPRLAAHPVGFPACKAEVMLVGAATMSSCVLSLFAPGTEDPLSGTAALHHQQHVYFMHGSWLLHMYTSAIDGGHHVTRISNRGGMTAGRSYPERHGSRGCRPRLAARWGSRTS
jgi:hypothetical protein